MSTKTKAFISFDFDHDEDLRNLFVGQAKLPDTPFEISDTSVKRELTGDWEAKVRLRIKNADQVVVICGEHMDTATGVNIEIRLAQEERKPYFLLAGRKDGANKKPSAAKAEDKLYTWTWENVRKLLAGQR